MNLRDMHYLVAVADNLHFGKAAKLCHVSQPTLSMQLKKLEEFLDVQLFERTNKTVMLTAVGKAITERARRILEEAEQIREISKIAKDQFSGDIKLGIFPTLAPYILPVLMPHVKTEFPHLNILLIEEKTPEIVQRLHRGDIDCALLAMPVNEPGFHAYTLFSEPFLLATSPTHPLAKRKTVTFTNIRHETMLLLEDGHCLREQALEICHNIGIGEANNFRATSMNTLLQMVAMTPNITLIPKLATTLHQQSLCYIPFKNPVPSRTIGLYIRNTNARTAFYSNLSFLINRIIMPLL